MPLFNLEYGYKGIYTDNDSLSVDNNVLNVDSKDIYKYTYYLADDIFDARYDPEFSPLIYPNETITINIYSKENGYKSK